MKLQYKNLPWKIIVGLALVQLIRPALSTVGAFDNFKPAGPLIVTGLVLVAWLGVAVFGKIKEPVKVLALAGMVYGFVSVLAAAFLQTFFTWGPEETVSVPVLLTVGLIAAVLYNAVWGALLGFIALGIRKILGIKPSRV